MSSAVRVGAEARWSRAAAAGAITHPVEPATRGKPQPKPTPSPSDLPPAAQLEQLLDRREIETRVRSLLEQSRDIRLQLANLRESKGKRMCCPMCSTDLHDGALMGFKTTVLEARETIRIDLRYWRARLKQLGDKGTVARRTTLSLPVGVEDMEDDVEDFDADLSF